MIFFFLTEGVPEDMRVDFYFQNVAFVYFKRIIWMKF